MKKLLLLMAAMLALTGCGGGKKEATVKSDKPAALTIENIKVENYLNKGVNKLTFSKAPERVIVIGSGELETLFRLGVEDRVVAVMAQHGYFEIDDQKKLEKMNKLPAGNAPVELLLSYKPDLLITQQCNFREKYLRNTDFWNQRGVATYIPLNTNSPANHEHEETIANEMRFIKELGQIFHKEERANKIVADTENYIAELQKQQKPGPKPKVLVLERFGKILVSYDKTKLAGKIVQIAGGDIPETPAKIGLETILEINPDVIFVVCSDGDHGKCSEYFSQHPGLMNVKAVKNKKVKSIKLGYIYASQIRTIDGIKAIAEGLK